jgi:hypothetical protein
MANTTFDQPGIASFKLGSSMGLVADPGATWPIRLELRLTSPIVVAANQVPNSRKSIN